MSSAVTATAIAAPSEPFSPSPIDLQAILFKLISPDYDLADIASCHRVNLVALMDWLERPEIVQLIKRLDKHVRRKARLAARAAAPLVIRSLRRTLKAFHREEDELEATLESNDSRARSFTQDPKAQDRRIRARELARKAASLLTRISSPGSSHARKRHRPLAGKNHLGLETPLVPQAAFHEQPSSVIHAKLEAVQTKQPIAPHPAAQSHPDASAIAPEVSPTPQFSPDTITSAHEAPLSTSISGALPLSCKRGLGVGATPPA